MRRMEESETGPTSSRRYTVDESVLFEQGVLDVPRRE